MKNPDSIPAQQDPCEVCDSPLDRYGLCPCIDDPALCTGAPVANEIFDWEDPKWRNFALAAQGTDWHCVRPDVSIRIKWDGWDHLSDQPDEELEYTCAEVRPSIALRFALRIALASIHVLLVTCRNLAKERARKIRQSLTLGDR